MEKKPADLIRSKLKSQRSVNNHELIMSAELMIIKAWKARKMKTIIPLSNSRQYQASYRTDTNMTRILFSNFDFFFFLRDFFFFFKRVACTTRVVYFYDFYEDTTLVVHFVNIITLFVSFYIYNIILLPHRNAWLKSKSPPLLPKITFPKIL
uniref:Uncharacterized protein n=1 Tax=Cacopsylla melanoneura TaxID=428564 RepID=A0A8D8UR07_9HEMI